MLPIDVRVPDTAAALEIAEPVLIKTYGKRQIDYERPLMAKLEGDVWIVRNAVLPRSKRTPHLRRRQVSWWGGSLEAEPKCDSTKRPVRIVVRLADGKTSAMELAEISVNASPGGSYLYYYR